MKLKSYTYDIDMPWDESAGLRGFTDRITITVESGDPGGEEGEFAEFMRESLAEWYDGAGVEIIAFDAAKEGKNDGSN